MGFQLVIAEGKEAGREFIFDQTSIVIGRTSDCDVVLYDPGVSRKHARIFAEPDGYFVEDMGSSNGTKVNGTIVRRQKLRDGDAVALGPVVFSFSALSEEGATEPPRGAAAMEAIRSSETRIVSESDIARPRSPPRARALAPADATPGTLEKLERSNTQSMRAISKPRVEAVGYRGPRTLSAAERARIRRESPGLVGSLRIFWAEADSRVRGAVVGGSGALVLLLLALVWYFGFYANRGPPKPPEPTELAKVPIQASFGYGEGVDYERVDQKEFSLTFNAVTSTVVILHFQARDISQGEVTVSVNGANVGTIAADTLAANETSQELIVPPDFVKRGEPNRVVFDNTKNPPNEDTWRIWNIWVEVFPLPQLSPEELVREASALYDQGVVNLERRDIGAPNRYHAWKDFRNAWLYLEAHPEPRPELYQLARDKMKEAQRELDQTCRTLLMQAEAAYNQRRFAEAKATLEHVRQYFPVNDQPCPLESERRRLEFDL